MAKARMISAPRRDWLHSLMAALTTLQLAWAALSVVDFIFHPWAPDSQYCSTECRLGMMLIGVPVMLAAAILVIRRTHGNVVGLCLLMWTATTASSLLRAGSPLLPYNALNFGWVGRWFLPLYFPNGQVYPLRLARPARWRAAGLIVFLPWGVFTNPNQSSGGRAELTNAWYIPALAPLNPVFLGVFTAFFVSILLLIIPSLWWRYHGSDDRTRQQMKWVAWAFSLIIIMVPLLSLAGLMSNRPYEYSPDQRSIGLMIGPLFTLFSYAAFAIAILRHRLYDIDVVIQHTLVYSVLTSLLALVYFGSILVLQGAFTALIGQGSPVGLIVSTLGIAALFFPLRAWVQKFIDSRFHRRKYDADKIAAGFAATCRDETGLNKLTARVVDVVQKTMQSESVTFWFKLPDDKASQAVNAGQSERLS